MFTQLLADFMQDYWPILLKERNLALGDCDYLNDQGALVQLIFCAKCMDPTTKSHLFSPTYLTNFSGFGISWAEIRAILEVDLKRAALVPGNMLSLDAIQEHVGHSKRVANEHHTCGQRNTLNVYLKKRVGQLYKSPRCVIKCMKK